MAQRAMAGEPTVAVNAFQGTQIRRTSILLSGSCVGAGLNITACKPQNHETTEEWVSKNRATNTTRQFGGPESAGVTGFFFEDPVDVVDQRHNQRRLQRNGKAPAASRRVDGPEFGFFALAVAMLLTLTLTATSLPVIVAAK